MPGFAEGVPQPEAELARAVQLPTELADIRHPERQARHRADGDLVRGHEGKRPVAQVGGGRLLQDGAGIRTPEPDARVGGGDVLELDRAV